MKKVLASGSLSTYLEKEQVLGFMAHITQENKDAPLSEEGLYPIHLACCFRDITPLRYLLDIGADPNIFHPVYGTPLHQCVVLGNHQGVVALLSSERAGLPVDHTLTDAYGRTPFRLACERMGNRDPGCIELVALFSGCDLSLVDCNNDGATLSLFVHINGSEGAQKLLSQCDAGIGGLGHLSPFTIIGFNSVSLLCAYIAELGHVSCLDRTDEKGYRPIHYVAEAGNIDILKVLLENNVSLEPDESEQHPIAVAMWFEKYEAFVLLYKATVLCGSLSHTEIVDLADQMKLLKSADTSAAFLKIIAYLKTVV